MKKNSMLNNISKDNKKTKNGMPSDEKINRLIGCYRTGQYKE